MDVHTGRSKGFAFITFDNSDDGYACMQARQGASFTAPNGEPFTVNLSVSHHKKQTSLQESKQVYFRNLPMNVTQQEIGNVLSQFGTITSLHVKPDNQHRWLLASVEFADIESARRAVEDGHGKPLFADHSTFPVMAKFADSTATKMARRERRGRGGHPDDAAHSNSSGDFGDWSSRNSSNQSSSRSTPGARSPATQQMRPNPDDAYRGGNPLMESDIAAHQQRSENPLAPPDEQRPGGGSGRHRSSSVHSDGSSSSSGKYRRNPYSSEEVVVHVE